MESTEERWAKRVTGWRQSGLAAKDYARSIGVNAGTLTYWAWQLRQRKGRQRPKRVGGVERERQTPALIEVISGGGIDDRFEVRLANGRSLYVPARFDATALGRLLEVLEREP